MNVYTRISIVFLSTMLISIDGAIFQERQHFRTGHENECYFKLQNGTIEYFKVRSSAYDEFNCLKYFCSKQGSTLLLEGHSCGVMSVGPQCTVTEQTRGRYPDCCPQTLC